MKNTKDFRSIIILSLAVVIIGCVFFWSRKNSRFENQKLGVPIAEFKADWGNPDKEFIYKADADKTVLIYDCNDFSGHSYVFKFDPKTTNLVFKYYDD